MEANESALRVDEFVATAREFCAWLEGPPYDDATERFTALVLLSTLYAKALLLPDVPEDDLSKGGPSRRYLDSDLERRVISRLDRFPARAYWRLDDRGDEGGHKVEDDVARELFLTYAAVRPTLDAFDSGAEQRDWAVWGWGMSFWADWGKHTTRAILVLHKSFHNEAWRDD